MEAMNTWLIMDLTVIPEKYGDEWAFRIRELGFTLYADTHQEGPELVDRAITTLLGSFGNDLESLFRYLDSHGVPYHVSPEASIIPGSRMARMWGGGGMLDHLAWHSSDAEMMDWPAIDSSSDDHGIRIFRHRGDLSARVTQ